MKRYLLLLIPVIALVVVRMPGQQVSGGPSNAATLNGVAVGSATATAGNLLIGQGSQWLTKSVSGDLTLGSSGAATVTGLRGLPLPAVTAPQAFANWTQVNWGTSSSSQSAAGPIYVVPQNTGVEGSTSIRALALAVPATPYTITMSIQWATNQNTSGGGHTGIGWYQQSSGKLVTLFAGGDATSGFYSFSKWTNTTTFSANYATVRHYGAAQNAQYLRIHDDGTNFAVYISNDGLNFMQFGANESRTDFLLSTGPSHYIFNCDSLDTTYNTQCTLNSVVITNS